MRKRKLIGLALLVIVAGSGSLLLFTFSRPQVIGPIAPDDLTEILQFVRQDLRSRLLPTVEWNNLFRPRYVISSVREYHAQHILWVEAHDDGGVDVFAGVSRDVTRDEGHVYSMRKVTNWTLAGYAYWASSDVAPAGIRVPASR